MYKYSSSPGIGEESLFDRAECTKHSVRKELKKVI